jgi:glutathione peroxidase
MVRPTNVDGGKTLQTGANAMNRLFALLLTGVVIMIWGCGKAVDPKQQEKTALRFKMESLDGEEVDLATYAGKVVMIVNVASKCGYTSQYEQLQALHEKYAEQGLAILGFPCNQFLGQEPGSAEEIRQFCRLNYGVTFDMFAKVDVKGKNACDLYRLLTSLDTKPKGAGKIGWNFEKFILDRNGFVVARFGSGTKPDAPEVISIIETELDKQAESAEPGPASGQSQDATLAPKAARAPAAKMDDGRSARHSAGPPPVGDLVASESSESSC